MLDSKMKRLDLTFPLSSSTTSPVHWRCGKTLSKGGKGNKQPVDGGDDEIKKAEVGPV